MVKKIFLGLLIFYVVNGYFASAKEECVWLNNSSWEQDKKNALLAVSYALVCEAGDCRTPTVDYKSGKVCLTDPKFPGKTLPQVVNDATYDAKWEQIKLWRQQKEQEAKLRLQTAENELKINPFTTEWLDTIDAKINNIITLNDAKTVLKQLVRYIIALETLEGKK